MNIQKQMSAAEVNNKNAAPKGQSSERSRMLSNREPLSQRLLGHYH